jgi:protein-disulfide isomerase
MGGAARGERRRRQVSGRPGAGPSVSRRPNRVVVAVTTVVVLAVVVTAVVVWLARSSGDTQPVAASYAVTADGTVVTAGQAGAPVTVDVYEDYLCPVCERFENRYGDELTAALNAGEVKVNYHAIAILDDRTNPPGYSTLAANASLCAVPAGIWPAYHQRLYADQPAEGSGGMTAAQLTSIGTELGAGPAFGQCVAANGNAAAIGAATEAAAANPALQTNGQFGTPTVAVGGRKIDISDQDWLRNAVGSR